MNIAQGAFISKSEVVESVEFPYLFYFILLYLSYLEAFTKLNYILQTFITDTRVCFCRASAKTVTADFLQKENKSEQTNYILFYYLLQPTDRQSMSEFEILRLATNFGNLPDS